MATGMFVSRQIPTVLFIARMLQDGTFRHFVKNCQSSFGLNLVADLLF